MVFLTGDCHGNFGRFSCDNFPVQNELTRDDIVIVLGDFGIWNDDKEEQWWFNWLSQKPFTIAFVDGNHENFNRLYSEFPIVEFCGGKAHKIRENIYHLMRGEIFTIQGKSFFAFGGASSHDIPNGAIDPDKFGSEKAFKLYLKLLRRDRVFYRVKDVDWWERELPTEEEMTHGIESLEKVNYKVDYVLSHCLPQSIVNVILPHSNADILTHYFDELLNKGLSFSKWYSGHYHDEMAVLGNYVIKYHHIERIL